MNYTAITFGAIMTIFGFIGIFVACYFDRKYGYAHSYTVKRVLILIVSTLLTTALTIGGIVLLYCGVARLI